MTRPNEPAFPGLDEALAMGLTKREWFAGLAMQGLLANQRMTEIFQKAIPNWEQPVATASLIMADALIAELAKGEKP